MNKKQLAVSISAVCIQLCCGLAYLWSLFQEGIAQTLFGGEAAKAALSYSLLLALLSVGSIVGGKLSQKFPTRFVVMGGGALAGLGFLCSGFVTADAPYLFWLTYGIMGGIGMGAAYTPTIALAQKWYPNNKGLITGIIVAALGLSGVIFTPVITTALANFGGTGVGESSCFVMLGSIILCVSVIGSLFLFEAPKTQATTTSNALDNSKSPSQVLKDYRFYLLTISYALACMGGLMMIGFATSIATFKDMAEYAAIGVIIISLFNSVGRLVWGFVCDKIGRMNTIYILMAGSAISTLLVIFAGGWWIFALIALIGFFYGGLLSTFPSATADLFGSKYIATVYGMVFVGFGIGAILSSTIAGTFKDLASASGDFSDMIPAFIIAGCAAFVALILIAIIQHKPKQKTNNSQPTTTEEETTENN